MSAAAPVDPTELDQPRPRRSRSASAVKWVLLGVALALVISFLCLPGLPLYSYELKTIDSRFRFRADNIPAKHVVIVAIDERSLNDSRLGRWPWDRKWHADLIRRLTADNPWSIAFDVIFSEPSNPASDGQLAAAIAASRRVFLALHPADMRANKDTAQAAERFAVQPGMVTNQYLLPQFGGLVPPNCGSRYWLVTMPG
ncbi:MAG: CHASE2 domain-containing protein, partial [Armatimonadota bacterium]